MNSLAVNFFKTLQPRNDDDFVDRLNYYSTPCILLVCAIIVTAKQYVGKPIQCWIPPQFTSSMEDYIESYCWIQNTYWMPMHEHIPDDLEMRENRQIGYYQWVPFILLMEALMFTTPCLIWRLCTYQSGVNIQLLITMANQIPESSLDERPKVISCVVENMQNILDLQWCLSHVTLSSGIRLKILRHTRYCGSYLTVVHLIIKFFYSINVLSQLFILNAFLKSDQYELYGLQVLLDLLNGREWKQSGHFPRVTLCDFEVRYVGNLNRYTVQCALIVNLFNEKVFVFIWCWFLVLSLLTMFSFTFWLFNCSFAQQRLSFVRKYLHIASVNETCKDIFCLPVQTFDRFVDDYLKADGVLILRMIANHAGDVVICDIISKLWTRYKDKYVHNGISMETFRIAPPLSLIDEDTNSMGYDTKE